ncbi:IS630 family transposase [Methylocystis bryophila]|uniref:IS630 family transposase n=1 Tax=Methylocystis bryophila TaxID=655015 RepID=UPI000C9D78F7|nr:IS630 family transposase [Methylocystis bryophila]
MARPYSNDLRERVAALVLSGLTVRAAAALMQVSVASSVRFARAARSTGSAAAKPMGGKRPYLLAGQRDFLLARLAEKPDLTLHALLGELRERGVVVSCDTLWRFLRKEKISFKKKTLLPAEQDRPDVARHRARWKKIQSKLDPKRLVFIDETWAKTNMTRTHGWTERGLALFAKAPYGHWKTTTFLAALRCDQITAPCVFDGPINGESFLAYVEQILAPTLSPGDVVVMDNLGSHKSAAVREAIRAKGARLIFLPKYSPDLNPIEQVFSKLKRMLRKAEERTIDALWRRVGILLDDFPPQECAAYLKGAGYASA